MRARPARRRTSAVWKPTWRGTSRTTATRMNATASASRSSNMWNGWRQRFRRTPEQWRTSTTCSSARRPASRSCVSRVSPTRSFDALKLLTRDPDEVYELHCLRIAWARGDAASCARDQACRRGGSPAPRMDARRRTPVCLGAAAHHRGLTAQARPRGRWHDHRARRTRNACRRRCSGACSRLRGQRQQAGHCSDVTTFKDDVSALTQVQVTQNGVSSFTAALQKAESSGQKLVSRPGAEERVLHPDRRPRDVAGLAGHHGKAAHRPADAEGGAHERAGPDRGCEALVRQPVERRQVQVRLGRPGLSSRSGWPPGGFSRRRTPRR